MPEFTYVGKHSRPEDGLDKVTGKARFVGDYVLPDMLYAKVLRSPVPHALLRRLDVSPALEIPGVVAVITSEDFVDHGLFGWPVKDAFALAWKKVRCVGDPVAAVAAESEAAAAAGVRAIRVEYDELEVVDDIHHATDADAPIVPDTQAPGTGNLANYQLVRYGDPGPVFDRCAVVQEETYRLKHQEHAYIETEGALAIPEPDGGLTVYANDQSPFVNRDNLVMLLGLPVEQVRVIQPFVGGSFGGKDDIGYQSAAQVGALALKTHRPVRLVLTRTESFLASYKREAMEIRIKLGATKEGELRAAQVDLLVDSGAYASMTPLAAWRATVHSAGAYRYEAVHADSRSVYTNNGYSGAMRGFGNTDAAAAIEQAIDELAYRFDQDPIEFRLKNCLRSGDTTMTGNRLNQSVNLDECLKWVRESSGWVSKRKLYASQQGDVRKGIGVACYFHGSSLGGEGADYASTILRIEADNSITLTSGLTDYGPGSRTVFKLFAAEQLGVNLERIHMLRPDTQTAIESGATVASRTTMVGGNATLVAARRLDQLLRWAASDALHCAPAQIQRHGELYIGASEEPMSFEQVVEHARQMGLTLHAQGKWQVPTISWDFERGTGVPYHCYTFGAQVAEIELNLQTGATRVVGVWAAHDGGRIIYPDGAYGQLYGGIAMGIGYALSEGMSYYRGFPQNLNLSDYQIPDALMVPPMEGKFVECDHPDGPYGALNLAEPMMIATAPAIANAIFQATGKRWRALPLSPKLILTGEDSPTRDTKDACRRGLGLE